MLRIQQSGTKVAIHLCGMIRDSEYVGIKQSATTSSTTTSDPMQEGLISAGLTTITTTAAQSTTLRYDY